MFKNYFSNFPSQIQSYELMRMKKIITYVNAYYQDKITLDQIADEVGLTPHYLCRHFKQQMNCTLFEYILDFRLRKSIELLEKDISYMCGFGDVHFYIKKFKKKINVTPYVYKKNLKEKDVHI